MRVQSLRLRLLLVAPVRLLLGLVWLVAARAAGAASGPALVAFAVGAFALTFLASNDPRARLRGRGGYEPAELPAGAQVAPAWQHAAHALFPSTLGVSVLAAIALAFKPELSALLAGVLVGLGVAALLRVPSTDASLYFDPRARAVYRKELSCGAGTRTPTS